MSFFYIGRPVFPSVTRNPIYYKFHTVLPLVALHRRASTMAPKRKAPSSVPSSREPTKRVATDAPSAPASLSRKRETGSPSKMTDGNSGEAPAEKSSMPQFNQSCGEEEYGVVQREFYPPEMFVGAWLNGELVGLTCSV